MMRTYRAIGVILLTALLLILCAGKVRAQYYDWGQDPASVRWRQIRGAHNRFIFPEGFQNQAVRLMNYMDTLRPHIGYGFSHGPMNMPVLMRTQNFSSNGIVMLAPRRMELITTPPASTFAVPWLKQLTAHEYRHAVQYNNLNRGVIRALGYLLGQQGSLAGIILLPFWVIEGDAVLAETQMTSFGRGLQPSFTIDYRALALEGDGGSHIDKYFCGSYKDHMPDHYHLGYQITSWTYTHYGYNIWDNVARYASRNPYVIFTNMFGLKKLYGTSSSELLRRTLGDLGDYWRSLPETENSSEIISTPVTSFTTYSSPIALDDSTVVALKADLAHTSRIVEVNIHTGAERVLHRTGPVNTGLTMGDGVLWWTELRQSTFWEQRVNSQLCFYDLRTGSSGIKNGKRRVLFPAPVEGSALPAWVEYDYAAGYSLNHGDFRLELPDTVSVHGFACDDLTGKFYFIGLSDGGMWIGGAGPGSGGIETVRPPAYSTLANLRADGGRLYYNSIASGKDEAHVYDLKDSKEYKITGSKYGSFNPYPVGGGKTLVTTYTRQGYLLALQDGRAMEEVPFSRMPRNAVNPPRIKWDVINLDSVKSSSETELRPAKYRKAANLFQFHSWAPVHFEPEELMGEGNFDVRAGITLLSQDPLNSMTTSLGYRLTSEGSLFTARVNYMGFAPKFEVRAEYGTMDQFLYKPSNLIIDRDLGMSNHFGLTTSAYLPILLNAGYHIRRLTPRIEFEHDNAKLYYPDGSYPATFRNGLQKLRFILQYNENVRLAHRDFLPRWGYMLRVTSTVNPFNRYMGGILSGYGRVYLPGMAQHHSLMLRGTIQQQGISYYNFRQKELFPRGAYDNLTPKKYGAFAIDYQLPLCYPDGGITSALYFRRIRANVFYDYARYKPSLRSRWREIYSYGLDINLDIVPLRMPSSTNSVLSISIHKPSNRNGVVVSAGMTLPI